MLLTLTREVMFFVEGKLNEEELQKFFDFLEDEKDIDINQKLQENPCYILEQQMKMMYLSPVIKNFWEQLKSLEDKNLVLGESLQTRMSTIAAEIRQRRVDASVASMSCTSEQIETLFPAASQDFKNLALYVGGYMAMIGYFNFVRAVTSPEAARDFAASMKADNESDSSTAKEDAQSVSQEANTSHAQTIVRNNPMWQAESTSSASATAQNDSSIDSQFGMNATK